MISRREALQRMGALTGGALSLSTVAGVLGGCRAGPAEEGAQFALSASERELLSEVAECIIPATDTAGARKAGVPSFIEKLLGEWMVPLEREHFLTGLKSVNEVSQKLHEVSFSELNEDSRVGVLERLAAEAEKSEPEVREVPIPESWADVLPAENLAPSTGRPETVEVRLRPFFAHVKELTMVGYYTSEIGASQELQYLHTPGRYEGCLPLEEVGRTWADA